MKLTRDINLHGVVLTIDEDAYQSLKSYLDDIEGRLPADEQRDVMDDLESRIAELLRSELFVQKVESVTLNMIKGVRARIGEPTEFGENKRPVIKPARITRQGVGRVMTIILKVILIIIGLQLLLPALGVCFGLIMAFFGVSLGGMALVPALGFELMGGSTAWTWVLCLSILAAIIMPIYMITYWIVKWSRERKHPSLRFWIISLLIWFLSIGGLIASAGKAIQTHGQDVRTVIEMIENMDELDPDDLQDLQELQELQELSEQVHEN